MNRLQGKDLINIGIFTAIYFVVMYVAAMVGFIPLLIPLVAVTVPLAGGIPMMLYFSKIKNFGMLTITGILIGVIRLLSGKGYWCLITGLIFGFLADLVLKSGDYKDVKRDILAHGVFSMWVIGTFIPIVQNRQAYYESLIPAYGQAYADTLMMLMPSWVLPVLLVICFIGGILGGLLGRAIFRKHFERAGIV